jgi:hypothetical protein
VPRVRGGGRPPPAVGADRARAVHALPPRRLPAPALPRGSGAPGPRPRSQAGEAARPGAQVARPQQPHSVKSDALGGEHVTVAVRRDRARYGPPDAPARIVHSGAGVRSDEVEALARERLGAEIQAVRLLRATCDGAEGLRVWSILTAHGTFWVVEGPAGTEIFRRIAARGGDHVARAVGRYLTLHPSAASPAPAAGASPARPAYACRACGATVAPARRSAQAERGFCRRCYRAEQARRRYQEDPEFRARSLARNRAWWAGRAPGESFREGG